MNKKPSAINIIWLFMIVAATVTAAYTGRMDEVTQRSFEAAKSAVTLAIALIGAMALWLGIVKVAETAGLMRVIARALRPIMTRLFPDVPSDHPAMSAMIMNMAANAVGMGNAATPLGIKAMQELDKLSTEKGTATNAMCLFLAINTSNVTILPLGVIAVRAAAGALSPSAILVTSIVATSISTAVAILAAKLMARQDDAITFADSRPFTSSAEDSPNHSVLSEDLLPPGIATKALMLLLIAAFLGAIVLRFARGGTPPVFSLDFVTAGSRWLIPMLMCTFLLYGFFKGVKVYEVLTDGAREGFATAVRIIPFLVAIFVAIGMFRASGAMDIVATVLGPITRLIGMPPEALPVALMRPLSGTGSFGLTAEIISNAPDSFLSFLVSTMQGSTETTFYVLAVYFGSVGIRRSRHALPAALCADAAGILASVFICRILF